MLPEVKSLILSKKSGGFGQDDVCRLPLRNAQLPSDVDTTLTMFEYFTQLKKAKLSI